MTFTRTLAIILLLIAFFTKLDFSHFFSPKEKENILKVQSTLYSLIFERRITFFVVFMLYFTLSHAIRGLGIQPSYGLDIAYFIQSSFNAFSEKGLLFQSIRDESSFFTQHFEPYLFLLHPLTKLPYTAFVFYSLQNLAQVGTLFFIIKYLCEFISDKSLRLFFLFFF